MTPFARARLLGALFAAAMILGLLLGSAWVLALLPLGAVPAPAGLGAHVAVAALAGWWLGPVAQDGDRVQAGAAGLRLAFVVTLLGGGLASAVVLWELQPPVAGPAVLAQAAGLAFLGAITSLPLLAAILTASIGWGLLVRAIGQRQTAP